MKYLYGASVQGIQDFIFETDKLREIAGASELVDYICTDLFRKCIGGDSYKESNLLIAAAGNMKYIFENKQECQKFVQNFPKEVMELAPGITLSQAVIEISSEMKATDLQSLEKKIQAQRNIPIVQTGMGLMISERSRRTGKPAVQKKNGEIIDDAQKKKRDFAIESNRNLLNKILHGTNQTKQLNRFPLDINEISGKDDKQNWVAVIHADGNDLGKKIIGIADQNPPESAFPDLSLRLENATKLAASIAFSKVVIDSVNDKEKIPFRPIILGGDDLTVIVKGNLALDFTRVFLEAFEYETKKEFEGYRYGDFNRGLTACAGIAYIKPNYPFHYGVHLAEMLCQKAKETAKETAKALGEKDTPSCLLFHKVHSSFIDDYKSIIDREFTLKNDQNIRTDFGPYFIKEQKTFSTIKKLQEQVKNVKDPKAPDARLRNWLNVLQVNSEAATQDLDRIKTITDKKIVKSLGLEEPFTKRANNKKHTHLSDILSISSI